MATVLSVLSKQIQRKRARIREKNSFALNFEQRRMIDSNIHSKSSYGFYNELHHNGK